MSEKMLALSRPLSLITMIGLFMTGFGTTPNLLGLYAVTAVFYICSSSLVLHWVVVEDRWRHAALYAEAVVATAFNFYLYLKNVSGPFEIIFLPLIITDTLYKSKAAWITAVGWILVNAVPLVREPNKDVMLGVLVNSTLILFGGSAGAIIRANRESKERSEILLKQVTESQEALQRAHRQLQESADRQLEAAALEERQRLAREIHDGVAHSLTSLIVHLQVGNRLLSKDPERAATVIAQCETMARDALKETRLAVRALRSADLGGKSECQVLKGLGEDFERVTGVKVTVTADASASKMEPDAQRVEQLYRIFQEALTNAYRHGKADKVFATLAVKEGKLHFTVSNNGLSPEALHPGGGLASMLERMDLIGGRIEFAPQPSGFRIEAVIPLGNGCGDLHAGCKTAT